MKFRTRTRRAAAATGALLAVLALGASPARADGASDPCSDATVVRTPQLAMVLADGESGTKRPL
ncbi:hypothetical protein HD597_006282 [Nonomuraea thailandensis]|uniref:Uncharacterized protein n=1 Tax=Nonomuraea thailandensis TaxID=1188745 RepID=A0A9X2GKD8_9ACTN|nr:hypothetical protein [Nonomuraea thailandensis]MCP2359262.1 hypothetical protein [Nonomuraea thailandensis]